jgi:hypothetical protein
MNDTPRTDAAYFRQGATMYNLAGEMKQLERELAEARDQRDTLLAALIHVRKGWGGMIVDPGCDCEDCVYLRPIDEAIAAAKIFNHEKP